MRLVASELLKIWTAPRTLFGLVLAELAIVALGTSSTIHSALHTDFPEGFQLEQPSLERDLIGVSGSAVLFALILGMLVITWECRHGTITQTFLVTPVRDRVLAAKALVGGLAGAALVVPALLLMFLITEIWVGDRVQFGSDELELIGRLFLGAAIIALLGVEIAAITGRLLGAIVVTFIWLAFAEPSLSTWIGVGDYLPHRAIDSVVGIGGEGSLSFGRGLLTIGTYVAGLAAAATVLTRRRDIT